jgi:hypothetical protein
MKCELEIKKVLFRSNLLRFSIKIGQECLPNHLKLKLNEKGTAKKEIKVKYKDGNLFDTTLTLAKNKGNPATYQINIPIEILEEIKSDFYYSWARFYDDINKKEINLNEDEKEFLNVTFPNNNKSSIIFHLEIKKTNPTFYLIKNLIIQKQATFNNTIKKKLVFDQSDWISRADLNEEKKKVERTGNKPAIYFITNSKNSFSTFYIGKSMHGINALTEKGNHRQENGANMAWDYFRYTLFNLDKHRDHKLLLDLETNNIQNFSRLLKCSKIKTLKKNYSIESCYSKPDIENKSKPIEILNTKKIVSKNEDKV